jgi:hypothetical protein
MSEKIIDFKDLRKLIRPDASPKLKKLFEMRLEEEAHDEAAEQKQVALQRGAPPIPEAQLVYNHASGTMGVAVRGAKLICPLPKGYGGPGLELAVIEGERLIAIQPDKPPLLIDPQTGTTRRL